MTCWVVTPIKAPDDCKTRLRAALSDSARRELVAGMLRHVLDVAGATAGVDEILLLGPSRHGLQDSIRLLADPGGGLNAALAAAARTAVAAGVDRLVIVAADLPLLTEGDLAALVGAAAGAVAIAPDRSGVGTNALSLPLPAAGGFRFHYGDDSFARHSAEAARLALPVQMIRSEGLGLDIDEPEDLAALGGR
jgi:2-phospho-L-lactate guanylyltransferase